MGIFLKDISLKKKTALITGATKGLGRGAAIALAQAGADILEIGRNQMSPVTFASHKRRKEFLYPMLRPLLTSQPFPSLNNLRLK